MARQTGNVLMLCVSICLVTAALVAEVPEVATDTNDDGREQQFQGESEKDLSISFIRQIAPILVDKCQTCHGAKVAENNYRLDSFARLIQPGDNELPTVTAGDLDESELHRLVLSADADERMPKEQDALTAYDIKLIERWIMQGATFDGPDPNATLASVIPRSSHPQPPETYPAVVPVTAVTFSPDGSELFTGGYHEVTVWSTDDGKLKRRIQNVAERTYGLEFSPDGSNLSICGGAPGRSGEVILTATTDYTPRQLLGTSDDVMYAVAFDSDGGRLAVAGADRGISIYDVATGQQERVIENHADWVMSVDWNTDSTKLVSCSRDKTAKVFEANTGQLQTTYSGHGEPVYAVAFSPDGSHVYSAGGDKMVHIWKTEDATKTAEISGYNGDVFKLKLTNDHLFSCSADKTVKQHTTSDRGLIRTFAGHYDWVYSLAVHNESGRVAAGCYDGNVRLWDIESGDSIVVFTAAPGYASHR